MWCGFFNVTQYREGSDTTSYDYFCNPTRQTWKSVLLVSHFFYFGQFWL